MFWFKAERNFKAKQYFLVKGDWNFFFQALQLHSPFCYIFWCRFPKPPSLHASKNFKIAINLSIMYQYKEIAIFLMCEPVQSCTVTANIIASNEQNCLTRNRKFLCIHVLCIVYTEYNSFIQLFIQLLIKSVSQKLSTFFLLL